RILPLFQCTLSAALCLASAVAQPEGPTKSSAGGYPKKVTTLKKRPTKTPSTAATAAMTTTTKPSKPRVKIASGKQTTATTKTPALDAKFSNLPADDLEFIKELDKQFKLHGNKIKIKVERDNSTSGGGGNGKKRTIDGELGYGYAHQGYDYTPPKFMFYPYSQHDIPATEAPETYAYSPADYEQPETTLPQSQQPHQQVTSVTIEPSYSYELKPQTSYETQPPTAHVEQPTQPEQPQIDLPQPQPQHETTAVSDEATGGTGYQEPVIVLRIPGPAKYAAHLQTLLQQYLEIRAAQYLQLLQDAEQRKHQQQPQPQPQQQQQQHSEEAYAAPEQHEQAHYHPEVAYAHQLAPTPPPVQYGAIDDVYQTYKGRQQLQPLQPPQHYETPAPEAYYAPTGYQQPATQFYYAQPQAQVQAQYESGYQPQLYLIAMAPQAPQYAEPVAPPPQQPIYVAEQEAPTAPAAHSMGEQQEQQLEHQELPITENNPRATHTKVIFNGQSSGADYAANMYVLPSHRPYQQQHHHHHHHQQQQQQQVESAHVDVEAPAADYHGGEEASMGVTQPPYNYHAHGLKMPHQVRQGKRAAKAEQQADHQLQQIREYVREKLGAEMGSAVEYKTTQLLEG
ncbi:hypothetical protein KR093_007044, partial [Drosophila rubida]